VHGDADGAGLVGDRAWLSQRRSSAEPW
jgi:hypothetical protein